MDNERIQHTSEAVRSAYLDILEIIDRLPGSPNPGFKQQLKDEATGYLVSLMTAIVACDGNLEEEELAFLASIFNLTESPDQAIYPFNRHLEQWHAGANHIPGFIQQIADHEDGREHVNAILRMIQIIANSIAILDGNYEKCEISLIKDIIVRIETHLDNL